MSPISRWGAPRRLPQWLQFAAVAATAWATMATSRPLQPRRNYPAWRAMAVPEHAFDGVHARLWIAKSGKEGLGVTVRLVSATAQPDVALRLLLRVGDGLAVRSEVATANLQPGQPAHLYVPLPFDAERAWNAGQRAGTLAVELTAGGQAAARWLLPLGHYSLAPHELVPRYTRIPDACLPLAPADARRNFAGAELSARIDRLADRQGYVVAVHVQRSPGGPQSGSRSEARTLAPLHLVAARLADNTETAATPPPPVLEAAGESTLWTLDFPRPFGYATPRATATLTLRAGAETLSWPLTCEPEPRPGVTP